MHWRYCSLALNHRCVVWNEQGNGLWHESVLPNPVWSPCTSKISQFSRRLAEELNFPIISQFWGDSGSLNHSSWLTWTCCNASCAQVAGTLGSTSIRHRSDAKVSDRCEFNVEPWVVVIWALSIPWLLMTWWREELVPTPIKFTRYLYACLRNYIFLSSVKFEAA